MSGPAPSRKAASCVADRLEHVAVGVQLGKARRRGAKPGECRRGFGAEQRATLVLSAV